MPPNMLKQTALFNILEKRKVTVAQYHTLYRLKLKPKMHESVMVSVRRSVPSIYINLGDCTLSDKGLKLIKEVDALFKPIKKLTNIELLGPDAQDNIDAFIETFPGIKLPNNSYARGNTKGITENFMWFFQEYDFEWETILLATETYVEEFRSKNWKFMRTAMYFIRKNDKGIESSDLATYCELLESGEGIEEERTIKSNVV